MIEIKRIISGDMQVNCYVVSSEGRSILIDVGDSFESINEYLKQRNLRAEAILLTHGHFDHIGSVCKFQQLGLKVYIHKADGEMLYTDKSMANLVGKNIPPCHADVLLGGGETLDIANMQIEVIQTGGHTRGSVCYVIEDNIFSGDTLFNMSIGRSDFPGGSYAEIVNSITEKLFKLEGDYVVYPGHGEQTTLEFERRNNPFVGGENNEF